LDWPLSGLAIALLNLEAPFTIALAVLVFGEHLSRREAAAAAIVVLGGALLGARGGMVRIAAARPRCARCLCWAIDNNISARLALKTRSGCCGSRRLRRRGEPGPGACLGGSLPPIATCAAALALGSVSYGQACCSTPCAAALGLRAGSPLRAAPFAGALASVPLLGIDRRPWISPPRR